MEANHMLLQQAHQQGFGWSRALPIRMGVFLLGL